MKESQTLRGHIVESEKDLYRVNCEVDGDQVCIPCKGRGAFRDKNLRPYVGDLVEITRRKDSPEGIIEEIFPRKNLLLRPPVANVDQVLLVQTIEEPSLNPLALDKTLVSIEKRKLPILLCFNKMDRASEKDLEDWTRLYRSIGYPTLRTNALTGEGLDPLIQALQGKISALAGPSGAGKSSLVAKMTGLDVEVGGLSSKILRGRQTTRKICLFKIGRNGYLFDTPGFSTLSLEEIEDTGQVEDFFPEFRYLNEACKFRNCLHRKEPACAVKKALDQGTIHPSRYRSYLKILEEVEASRSY